MVWWESANETSLGGAVAGIAGAAGGDGVKAASLSPLYLGIGGAGGAVRPSGSPRPTSVDDVEPRTYMVKAPPHEPRGRGGGGTEEALSSAKKSWTENAFLGLKKSSWCVITALPMYLGF